MAPPEYSNVDFYNLEESIRALDLALDAATSQKTVRKGARAAKQHEPVEKLREHVEDDLSKVLNSPLRPTRGSGYSCLPLGAVQPVRRLHEMLSRAVGPNGDAAILEDVDTAVDLHNCLQSLVASVDSKHPFLKVKLDFDEVTVEDNDDHDDGGDQQQQQQQQQTPDGKGKGKQIANNKQQQTWSKKGKGRKVSRGKLQAPAAVPAEGLRRSVRILARQMQTEENELEDIADVEPQLEGSEGEDEGEGEGEESDFQLNSGSEGAANDRLDDVHDYDPLDDDLPLPDWVNALPHGSN